MLRVTIVRQRELHYHLVPSNPQIAGGKNIDALLGETGRRAGDWSSALKHLSDYGGAGRNRPEVKT
jgi:hypothetical protein